MTIPIDRRLPDRFFEASLRADVLAGLTATPKSLPPKWFYDERGSELFDKITLLDEYYPTRAEREILAASAGADRGGDQGIDAGRARLGHRRTRPCCCSTRSATLASSPSMSPSTSASPRWPRRRPGCSPGTRACGCTRCSLTSPSTWDSPSRQDRGSIVFLGGTIGNLLPAERAEFLASLRAQLRDGDALLLGTDLVKDPAVLVAAYDDAAGVTAEFNKNILRVLNAELDGNFDLDEFEHVAIWNAAGRSGSRCGCRSAIDQTRAAEGDGPARPVRRRGRDANRDLSQIPPRRDRRRTRRGRARPAALVDRRAGQVRPVSVGAGLTSANGPRQPSDRVPLNRMTAG